MRGRPTVANDTKKAAKVEIPVVTPVTKIKPASLDVVKHVTSRPPSVTVERPVVNNRPKTHRSVTSATPTKPTTADVTSDPAVLKEAINNVVDQLPVIANETVQVGITLRRAIPWSGDLLRMCESPTCLHSPSKVFGVEHLLDIFCCELAGHRCGCM